MAWSQFAILAAIGVILGGNTGAGKDQAGSAELSVASQHHTSMSIDVTVMGQPARATVDTGATYAMIDDRLLPPPAAGIDQRIEIVGVDGMREYQTIELASVKVGDIELGPMGAAINDNIAFPGDRTVLPAAAFEGRVLDFDFIEGQLSVHNGAPEAERGAYICRMDYQLIRGLPFLQARINKAKVLILIDTGATVSFINEPLSDAARTRVDEELTKVIFGAGGDPDKGSVHIAKDLILGKHKISRFKAISSESPIFAHLGIADQPVMVMGTDLLKHFRLQFDRHNQTVQFERPMSRQESVIERARRSRQVRKGCWSSK